jgi:diguanylate cyclase (GGDEF)-like protein
MGLVAAVTVGAMLVLIAVVAYQRRHIARLGRRVFEAARTDPMTGLLNRPTFEQLLGGELERSRRSGRPLALLVGELDGLGLVNDRGGRRAGDGVLELVGRDLGKWKRRVDTAARTGAQQFALLLPETDAGASFLAAERLRRAAHRTFGDEDMPVTISFGVAGHPEHGDEPGVLLKAAERAVAAAKQLGGDRSVVYCADETRMLRAAEASGEQEGDAPAGLTRAS